MRKYILSILLLFPAVVLAQSFNISIGYLTKTTSFTKLEYETKINNSYGTSINSKLAYNFHDTYSWDIGINLNKTISRFKNSELKLIIGPYLGATNKKFYVGGNLCLEYTYTLLSQINLFIRQDNYFNFIHNKLFQNGLSIGVKFPLKL